MFAFHKNILSKCLCPNINLNLKRYTKGAESQVMCFEYVSDGSTEDRSKSDRSSSDDIPRRPRWCSIDETKNSDNDCICYIIQASGQQGPKQTPDGAGFRPEIDYIEIRRADGTYGSERKRNGKRIYQSQVDEFCANAEDPFPNVTPPLPNINHSDDDESAVKSPTSCTNKCGGQGMCFIFTFFSLNTMKI